MAGVVVRYPTSQLTEEQYNAVNQKLQESGDEPAEGLEMHVCFGTDGDLKVSEIWSSREQYEAFQEKLRPAIEAAGVNFSGEPDVFEVVNLMKA
jgi:hypothetical protein